MSTPTISRSWQTVPLGFQGTPYPIAKADGSLVLSGDYVPLIASNQTPEQVNGIAFRDMPAPEHLPYFLNLLDAINKKGRRVFMYLSEPGIGKSFLANVVSNMMIGEKALSYECGDKRLGDLLFTTDLSERPEQTLYDRVLLKMQEGKSHPLSKARLAKVLGDAFDPIKATVDWEKLLLNVDNDIALIDETFKSVAQAEGINQQSTIALREDNGLLIQAYEQDRIALADEYNKGKPGSDTALQTILQWLAREGQSAITVQSNSGRSYELGSLDAKPGFFAILTGNSTTDGIGTFELSQSQYSRLQPSYLPNLGRLGLTHRFCQVMVGLPVSTLYRLYGPSFEDNAEGFALFCQSLRTLGLSPEEIEKIPAHHRALLDHPMQVIEAAEKCAEFFVRWQNKTNLNNSNLPANLMAELTEDYVKANTPDPRLFIMLFHRALERAERRAAKVEAINPSFVFAPITSADLAALSATSRTGSAFMELIAEEIKNKTPNQPNLRAILMSDAAELGLLPSTQQRPDTKTLADWLNVKQTPATAVNRDATRNLIKDWGTIFGAPAVAQDGDQLTPFLPALERTLSLLRTDKEHFVSFTADPNADISQPQGPFQLANIRKVEFEKRGNDAYLVGDDESKPFEASRLLKASQFIASLTIPHNDMAFARRYLAAEKSQPKLLQAFSVVVADDHAPEEERALLVLSAASMPLSYVIIGNGSLSPQLEKKLKDENGTGLPPAAMEKKVQEFNQANRYFVSYIDAAKGLDVKAVITALKRDANYEGAVREQLATILEPSVAARVSNPVQSAFQKAAAGITGQKATDADKIAALIKEILKGEAIRVGYVAVTAPTRTADLMKGIQNVQSMRPAAPSAIRSLTQVAPGGM